MQKKSSQNNLFDHSDSPNGDGKRSERLPFTDFCHYFNNINMKKNFYLAFMLI